MLWYLATLVFFSKTNMLTRELTNFWFFKYFQLAVGAVLGGVIYAIVKSKDVFNFHIDFDLSKDNENAILLTLLLIIIVVFGFLVIFTFLGCCGAACQNQCMLGSFIIILFIFLGANVAGIVYLFYHFDNEVEMAKHGKSFISICYVLSRFTVCMYIYNIHIFFRQKNHYIFHLFFRVGANLCLLWSPR